jgi:hypothetical protein
MLRAVLLPDGPLERTLDVELGDWTEPGWPAHLALTVVHPIGVRVEHDGHHVEVRPVAPTYWRLTLVLPGDLGVYQRAADVQPASGHHRPHPVTIVERLPAAATPRPVGSVDATRIGPVDTRYEARRL